MTEINFILNRKMDGFATQTFRIQIKGCWLSDGDSYNCWGKSARADTVLIKQGYKWRTGRVSLFSYQPIIK